MPGKAYRIKNCWGIVSNECPNLMLQESGLKHELQAVIEASGWPKLLIAKLSRDIKPLDQFSLGISGCPNGCSRSQIADLGLLQAQHPGLDVTKCTGCGECMSACREEAIDVQAGLARIRPEQCLSCGACLLACPEMALNPLKQGYRAQIGGKLGRHPRLGDELPGIFPSKEIISSLARCLDLHQKHYRPGVRFGQLLAEKGTGALD